jgi:hypothetical protein
MNVTPSFILKNPGLIYEFYDGIFYGFVRLMYSSHEPIKYNVFKFTFTYMNTYSKGYKITCIYDSLLDEIPLYVFNVYDIGTI